MFKEERQEKILEILESENYVTADALAKALYASLPTIRRDLADLQKQGLILRSHGGAKRLDDAHAQLPFAFRNSTKREEKRRLSRAAAALIHDGDVVFIDSSTTVSYMANYLTDRQSIIVITDSIPTALALRKNHIVTYLTGGELTEDSLILSGTYAENIIRNFNIDIMFFSSVGVNKKGFIVDSCEAETILRRKVFQSAEKRVYVCDGEKFGLSAPLNIAPLCEMDCVITNAPIPPEFGVPEDRVIALSSR